MVFLSARYRAGAMTIEPAELAAITALVEPEAQALGFDLVRVRWFGGDEATLQIMAERPTTGQLTIDDCAALSRAISERFDGLEEAGQDPVPVAYRLEVSSPGIDRPLTRLKDFVGWVGHDARVTLIEGIGGRKTLTGRIDYVLDDAIHLTDRKSGELHFPFADVAVAKLVLTDALIAATAPLSSAGADILEDAEEED